MSSAVCYSCYSWKILLSGLKSFMRSAEVKHHSMTGSKYSILHNIKRQPHEARLFRLKMLSRQTKGERGYRDLVRMHVCVSDCPSANAEALRISASTHKTISADATFRDLDLISKSKLGQTCEGENNKSRLVNPMKIKHLYDCFKNMEQVERVLVFDVDPYSVEMIDAFSFSATTLTFFKPC